MMIGYASNEGILFSNFLKDFLSPLGLPLDLQKVIPCYYKIQKDSDLSKKVADMIDKYYFKDDNDKENYACYYKVVE